MNGKTDTKKIPDVLLPRLSECLTAKIGLHFSNRNINQLHQKMTAAMMDFGYDNIGEFTEWLLSSSPTQNQIETLASHLTVGETHFFRDGKVFEILEQSILPDLIDTRRRTGKRLRFWSAGCSTGEEPYSIAILIKKLIPDLKDWNITILATDINSSALQKSRGGVYSDWSFRETPPFFKDKYFERVNGNRHRLLPDIRKMVTFSYLNLSEDVYPTLQNNTNAMDVIFCRNVLMYFALEHIKLAVERFYRSLIDGGCLIVSPVETALLNHSPFLAVRFQSSTFYKRDLLKVKKDPRAAKNIEIDSRPCPPPLKTAKHRRVEKLSRPTRQAEFKRAKEAERTPYEEAAILYRNGSYEEAEERLRQLMANGGRNQETVVLFTKVLANQGRIEEAIRWCEEAVSADKCNPHLHYLLATILDEQKRFEEVGVSLRKALYLDRNFVLAHFALANLSLRAGKTADARKHFGNVTEILSGYKPDDVIPESEGITAGRLAEIIGTFWMREVS